MILKNSNIKRRLLCISLLSLFILALAFTSEYTIYIPLVTSGKASDSTIIPPSPQEGGLGIRNVLDFGAVGNGVVDDAWAIQAAINDLPKRGGIVYFPPGTYAVSKTIVVSRDGVTLQGSGGGRLGYMWGTPPEPAGATVIKYIGPMHGTVVRVGNGSVPNAGCALKDFVIDGNNLARHLVVADATYYLHVSNISGYGWRDGYAVVIKHSANVYGAGEKYHTWEHITFVNPYQNGAGIDIAPEGSGNINQINITGCNIGRSNINNSSLPSLRLGYVDHITFNRCVFMPSISAHDWSQAGGQYIRLNPYAITVQPIAGRGGFPNNITFYGTSIYGGINYVDTIDWMQYRPALLFYPFYTADGQTIPPKGYINGSFGTLPSGMVGGFTELGQPLQ